MNSEIEEIKAKVDIAELIGDYVKLLPAGMGSFKGLCPFHNEKTPSFMVTPSRGRFKCFGCGEGGDVFTFLMKVENLEFPEALKVLAKSAGVTLRQIAPQADSAKNRLYNLCELASRYWHKVLLDSPRAKNVREYLHQRGISDDSIMDFRLGYAVNDWDNLILFLRKKNFRDNEIFEAGLSIKKDRSSGYYDRFRDRLMFPIIDHHGRTVGFGGRTLRSDEPAKYINTPQTTIYNKSEVLYGLYQAKEAIRKENLCVLTEGYMDVIPSHQAGAKNTISISGTALTSLQLGILKRYSGNLALALDMDAAGQRAALRSIEIALENEINVQVVTLPFGKDPGECATKDPDAYRQAIRSAQPVMEYFWNQAMAGKNMGDTNERKLAIKFMLEKIASIGNTVEKDYWLKKLSQDLSVSEGVLRELAAKIKKTPSAAKPLNTGKKATANLESPIFQRILAIIWAYPGLLPKLIDDLQPEYLEFDKLVDLYKQVILFYTKNVNLFDVLPVDKPEFDLFTSFDNWLEASKKIPDEEKSFLGDSFLLSQKDFIDIDQQSAKADLENLIRNCKSNYISQKINFLKTDLTRAERAKDEVEVNRLSHELNELIKQKV